MTFAIGDTVVHPQHGVGQVVNLEDREFEPGKMRQYYEISIPSGGTVWMPADLHPSGLRSLAARSEIAQCRQILLSRPASFKDDVRTRQANLAGRLKQGTIRTQCEIVRDLFAFGEHKSLYGSMAGFFRQTQNVLCQEWALVEGVTFTEALQEVTSLLEKSRASMRKAKA
ncbi:MAG: hypothetical protein DCC56_02140 [Anaerolineae bacterium]|nr:MAG: hypothetical protein DCC56_02140 [Anaerolineae bacterium]WKZ44837.1 MAG: CarD family transcriptional regulator [Anaerolineales bacterium]